jgi:hypothetical protein
MEEENNPPNNELKQSDFESVPEIEIPESIDIMSMPESVPLKLPVINEDDNRIQIKIPAKNVPVTLPLNTNTKSTRDIFSIEAPVSPKTEVLNVLRGILVGALPKENLPEPETILTSPKVPDRKIRKVTFVDGKL